MALNFTFFSVSFRWNMSFKFTRKSQKYCLVWYILLVKLFILKSISLFEFSRLVSKYQLSDIIWMNSVVVHGKYSLWYWHYIFSPPERSIHPLLLNYRDVLFLLCYFYLCMLSHRSWQSYFQWYLGYAVMKHRYPNNHRSCVTNRFSRMYRRL